MNPQVRDALKDFWKYAFCTNRPASRFEFLTVFTWYISPVVTAYIVVDLLGDPDKLLTKIIAFVAYGILLVPYASLTIRRLRTVGRSAAWSFLFILFWIGLVAVAPLCLSDNIES